TGPRRVRTRKPATSERSGDGSAGRGTAVKRTPRMAVAGTRPSSPRPAGGLEALVTDLEGLHGDLAVLCVQARARPLARPAAAEVPAHDLLPVLVEEHDRPFGAVHQAVHPLDDPVPEGEVADHAALEDNVGELLETRDLADRDVLAAVPVF